MTPTARAAGVLTAALLASAARPAVPDSSGFSTERLARLDVAMQQSVTDSRIAGLVTLVQRRGHVAHLKAYGQADRERHVPMRTDTIFRLASASKIVTTVAVMQLMEEGKLLISDPLSKYIPAFKNSTVAIPAPPNAPAASAPFTVVPAKRQPTIHDVLTKTVGIAYPTGPTRELYEAAGFHQWYFADNAVPMCTMIEKLPGLPFNAHPGEQWMNGYTADILGCIIEKISGTTLADFESRRIFQPLKMVDTHFFLPKDKEARLATVYSAANGLKPAEGEWTAGQGHYFESNSPAVAFSGGAGLLTTAPDYARFLQMLLNGGELDGTRIISRKTVELMTRNHVGKLYKNGQSGFGFNVEVTIDTGDLDRLGSVGDYGWQGAYFPRFLVDPSEQTIALFFAQLNGYGGGSADMHDKFLNLVYQAMDRQESTH